MNPLILFSSLILMNSALEADGATWMTFKLAHLLNPESPEGMNCDSWTVSNWTTWLHVRDILNQIEREGDVPKPMYEKPIDSVVVASQEELLGSFSGVPLKMYKEDRLYVWSSGSFRVYNILFDSRRGLHRVYRCVDLFLTVRLLSGNPIHFERAYPQVLEHYRGNLQIHDTLKTDNCHEVEGA